MNDVSKIMLSDDELHLVTNTGWILTKRVVMEKVDSLLGYVAEKQKTIVKQQEDWLPGEVVNSEPKIARGENYLQLPYLMLDYPRRFDAEDIFAVRTMFWWGNFFSVTLHLSGKYKENFQQRILHNVKNAREGTFICIHENQWHHHFEKDNYRLVAGMSADELTEVLAKNQFIKTAIRLPLQPWAALPELLENSFAEMMNLLKH